MSLETTKPANGQQSPSTTAASGTPEAPVAAKTVADLPPAALDLASRLFDFARAGATNDLSQYLAAGVPTNLTNHAGDTLIMLAAYHGHAAAVQLLLDRGADPNVLNDRGQSPLAGAVFKGYADVVETLVKGGADGELGQPCARDAARMFRRQDMFDVLGIGESQ